ncbi:MAG TPA: isoprenylcysteine carboxylmethyltransferase family protein [Sphingomicrobium sp.]|nr:isoprenylcysteine carboxylmethyltransferase family protein [Sphingomicrobium sp.]
MSSFAVRIGWLQFWLFSGIGILFFIALIRALMRRTPESGARREGGSRIGIIVQSVSFFFVGFGRVRPELPLFSPAALAGAAAVLLLMGGAVYLFVASANALGKNWSFEARTRSDHQLVREGPYARVRHPIYLGMLLFLLGLAVAFGHWLQLAFALPLFLAGTAIRTRLEDRLLESQFGPEFRDYAQATPALIPRLR